MSYIECSRKELDWIFTLGGPLAFVCSDDRISVCNGTGHVKAYINTEDEACFILDLLHACYLTKEEVDRK